MLVYATQLEQVALIALAILAGISLIVSIVVTYIFNPSALFRNTRRVNADMDRFGPSRRDP